MKQFLLTKFLQFDQNSVDDFQTSIANMMPLFNKPIISIPSDVPATVWGFTNRGFWTVTLTEAYFYDFDGTIHVISSTKDEQYYLMFRDLYYASVFSNSRCQLSKPLDFSEETWVGKNNKKIYYFKFQTPAGGYGTPLRLKLLLEKKTTDLTEWNKETLTIWYTDYINEITWLLSAIVTYGYPLYPICANQFRLEYDAGSFFYMLPNFTHTKEDAIKNYLIGIEGLVDYIKLDDKLNIYAREQWLPILNT